MMIENFRKIRSNGEILYEGHQPGFFRPIPFEGRVTAIEWEFEGQTKRVEGQYGAFANIVPGRNFLTVLIPIEIDMKLSKLEIYRSNGLLCSVVPTTQIVKGRERVGEFLWFSQMGEVENDIFWYAFRFDGGSDYLLKIRATDCVTLEARETR